MLSFARKLGRALPWLIFIGWYGLAALSLIGQFANEGAVPFDYQAYDRAARAIDQGDSPYLSPEITQQIWLSIHQYETDVLTGQGQVGDREIVGPYVYPPTLALWLSRLQLNAAIFIGLLLFSIFGFGWLWLKGSDINPWWLLLIVGSFDVVISLASGNVELLLLFLTLLSAWLMARQRGLWATPAIALTVLIKPFYAIFFAAFGLFLLAREGNNRSGIFKALVLSAGAVLLLIGVDVVAWGNQLRGAAVTYLSNALAYQWLVLPPQQQTPMSIWNRTLLQGLVSGGVPAQLAQIISLGVGILLVAGSVFRMWGARLPFGIQFAVAFVLLYLIRPVGWGLPYLEIVVLAALWPAFSGKVQRGVALSLMLALMLSHWLALVLTAQGVWIRLVTLQSAEFPWETWLVLPACWLALMWAVPRQNVNVISEKKNG